MKTKIKSFTLMFVAFSSLTFVVSSCKDDEDVYKVMLDYSVVCSEDLLNFANPIVSYEDNNGITQKDTLTLSDFIRTSSNDSLIWKCPQITFDHWGIQHEFVVAYEIKQNVNINNGSIYTMRHNIHCKDSIYGEYTRNKIRITNKFGHTHKQKVKQQVQGEIQVKHYLDSLKNNKDGYRIIIDENGGRTTNTDITINL